MWARYRYVVQEAFVGLRRNVLMTLAVVLSVAVSLSLLGQALLVRRQVTLMTDFFTGKVDITLFLCDGRECAAITPEQQDDLETTLAGDPLVASVLYESKEQAFEKFQELFVNDERLLTATTVDDLPASFRVKLVDPLNFDVIYDRFVAFPGVEDIFDQREFLDRLFSVTRSLNFIAVTLAIVQLLAAMALIANTIRVAAFARREETSIMKLVGASNWYIRLPFVIEGIVEGLLGALVSWIVLIAVTPIVVDQLRESIEFTPFIDIVDAVVIGPILLVVGVLIAGAASVLALRRYLDV